MLRNLGIFCWLGLGIQPGQEAPGELRIKAWITDNLWSESDILKCFLHEKCSFLYHDPYSRIEWAELHTSYVFVSYLHYAPSCFHALLVLRFLRELCALTVSSSHWIKLHNECTIVLFLSTLVIFSHSSNFGDSFQW